MFLIYRFFFFILSISLQKYFMVIKYHNNNRGITNKKEINRLAGILITIRSMSSKGRGIINVLTSNSKDTREINRIIIKKIIPLILGNLYSIKAVGAKRIIIIIIMICISKIPEVNCMNKIDIIEKNPHITEIA